MVSRPWFPNEPRERTSFRWRRCCQYRQSYCHANCQANCHANCHYEGAPQAVIVSFRELQSFVDNVAKIPVELDETNSHLLQGLKRAAKDVLGSQHSVKSASIDGEDLSDGDDDKDETDEKNLCGNIATRILFYSLCAYIAHFTPLPHLFSSHLPSIFQ